MRNSQFVLGDAKINYQTSSKAQSELIPEKGRHNNQLTKEQKLKLQSSQFTLGSSKNDFETDYNLEYYDKSSIGKNNNPNEAKHMRDKLRSTNYDMGNDKVDYISENAGQYKKPVLDVEEIQKTKEQTEQNTKNLRSQHFDFGTENVQWNSSNRSQFTPKKIGNNRYDSDFGKKIREGNIPKYNEDRDFKSETMHSYNKKPLAGNSLNKEARDNLRRNHFDFGDKNTNLDTDTVNRIDYKDPRLDKNFAYKSIALDKNKFRRSQWSLNGGNDENYFNTTYSRTMTPKKNENGNMGDNINLKTHIQIGSDKLGKEDYQSVYDQNYGNKNLLNGQYYINNNDKGIADNIRKFNKNSHFELMKGKGDYDTTMGHYYKYNLSDAKGAYHHMDKKTRTYLRETHYQLGDSNEMEKETSNRRDYRAYPMNNNMERISSGKRNMESMKYDQHAFDANTIYQTDYTKKPLPKEDDDIDLYLFNKYVKSNQ